MSFLRGMSRSEQHLEPTDGGGLSEGLYIGRSVDPTTMEVGENEVRLDPNRLTRHAVCFGMTGSGKTGLCVTLLEELAIHGTPTILIDPKGDMANLALAFSDHAPKDFEPWVDAENARREGMSIEDYAERTAKKWQQGLDDWGVGKERVRAFSEGADVAIYTPGSSAGIAVNVLGTLGVPPDGLADDPEGLADLVTSTTSGLLGLIGVEADPVTDPAHILIARILSESWRQNRNLDLEALILQIVDPPFARVGVFPVDDFFKRSNRMKLAVQFNGLVASPAFASWREGARLDIDELLAPQNGKTPVRVFYLSHLDESSRMFFASMLLGVGPGPRIPGPPISW